MRRLFALLLLISTLAACGSDIGVISTGDGNPPPVDIAPEAVVFTWSENGGCAMAGPNCARYEVSVDGSVKTYREGHDEVVSTGTVPPKLLEDWHQLTLKLDVEELKTKLGPGETTAAYDGVDFVVGAPESAISLSSTDFEFDQSEQFFALATEISNLAAQSAPLEIEMRQ